MARRKKGTNMANRMKREGLIEEGKHARVSGCDRLAERALWFPHGIVSDAIVMASQENSGIGAIGGTRRSVAEEFRMLETLY